MNLLNERCKNSDSIINLLNKKSLFKSFDLKRLCIYSLRTVKIYSTISLPCINA